MIEKQIPVLDSYLKSSYGLGSSNYLFQYVGYSILCFDQLIATFTPLLYKFVTFALILVLPIRPINDIYDQNSSLSSLIHNSNKDKIPEPIILNQYRSFVDDRKAKVGSLSDIQRLRQHGYKPLRFLSPSFIELIGIDESKEVKKVNNKKSKVKDADKKKKDVAPSDNLKKKKKKKKKSL